jgi:hypothetical protein
MNELRSLASLAHTRYQYEVCGLRVESDTSFSLPETAQKGIPDIRFRLKTLGQSTAAIYPDRVPIGQIKNGAGYPSIAVYQIDRALVLDCHNRACVAYARRRTLFRKRLPRPALYSGVYLSCCGSR